MFENIIKFFKNIGKSNKEAGNSKDAAKERLHLVLMQDRANVSADFLDLMRQEIIEVIKKYIDVDENEIDVRLANKTNEDGTTGAPALYANIPIKSIKDENKKEIQEKINLQKEEKIEENSKEEKQEEVKKLKQEENKKEAVKEEVKQENVEEVKEKQKQEPKEEEKQKDKNEDTVKVEE